MQVQRPPKPLQPWLEVKETGISGEFGTVIPHQSLLDPIKPRGQLESRPVFDQQTCSDGHITMGESVGVYLQ